MYVVVTKGHGARTNVENWLQRIQNSAARLICLITASLYTRYASSTNLHWLTVAVALLGLVSPGAATDGATLFFSFKKTDDLFSHRPLESDDLFSCRRLLTTPIFPRRLYSVLSKLSHKKIILFRCHPR